MTETFEPSWLALRASADRRARSRKLACAFLDALPRAPHVVDLAAGAGANARYLAALAQAPLDWTLLDADPALLGHARLPARTLRRSACDLAGGVPSTARRQADGITLSAFLDLVSARWVEDFAEAAAAGALPCLAALSVDGRISWRPADDGDAVVAAAFHADQLRDKGFGRALGPGGGAAFAAAFRRRGYAVARTRADWRLGRHDRALLRALVNGTAQAARGGAPGAAVEAWRARRIAALEDGVLAVTIGHEDVLALPGRRHGARGLVECRR